MPPYMVLLWALMSQYFTANSSFFDTTIMWMGFSLVRLKLPDCVLVLRLYWSEIIGACCSTQIHYRASLLHYHCHSIVSHYRCISPEGVQCHGAIAGWVGWVSHVRGCLFLCNHTLLLDVTWSWLRHSDANLPVKKWRMRSSLSPTRSSVSPTSPSNMEDCMDLLYADDVRRLRNFSNSHISSYYAARTQLHRMA